MLGKNWCSGFIEEFTGTEKGESRRYYTVKTATSNIFPVIPRCPGNNVLRCQLWAFSKQTAEITCSHLPLLNPSPGSAPFITEHSPPCKILLQQHNLCKEAPGLGFTRLPLPSPSDTPSHHHEVCAALFLTKMRARRSWHTREQSAALRQQSTAQKGPVDLRNTFVTTTWFPEMHAPRKHHAINTKAPNHVSQPLLAEKQEGWCNKANTQYWYQLQKQWLTLPSHY